MQHLRYVRRIAAALLALQNAGHAKYTVWQYTFYCDCDVGSALQKQAKTMESEFQQWTNQIVDLRNNFHALNYFTTQQLHILRQKLGQLDCNTISHLPSEVLSLLMSISCQINEEVVISVLKDRKGADIDDAPSNHNLVESFGEVPSNVDQANPENEVSIEGAIEKKLKILCDQLSEIEQSVYAELKEANAEVTVYLGIKYYNNKCSETPAEETLYDEVLEWCMENDNRYEHMDKQDLLEELNACSISKSEDSAIQSIMNSSARDSSLLNRTTMQNDNSADISETEQKVIEYGFESGLAREAAVLYPNDVEKAVEYCLNVDNASVSNSQLFHSVVTGALNEAGSEKRYALCVLLLVLVHCMYVILILQA